jgi:hypothetical protein
MKRRTSSLIVPAVLLFLAWLAYVGVRSARRTGVTPKQNPGTRRSSGARRLPRQTPGETNHPDGVPDVSCSAMGVTCASTYLSAWNWPQDDSCVLGLRNGYPVPDPRCTPGGVVPGVSAASLRDPQWRTKCIRNCQSTEKQKHVTYIWYGLISPVANSGTNQVCELDHLVPLELGGADGLGNIWPQCGPDQTVLRERYFKRKDQVENYLAAKVRSGQMTLGEAQRGIASDWTQYLDLSKGS